MVHEPVKGSVGLQAHAGGGKIDSAEHRKVMTGWRRIRRKARRKVQGSKAANQGAGLFCTSVVRIRT